ncbi:hypothetical protein, partial [Microcoleus sp. POL10_C6]|uniref:hypothetical protein n=1 Tax=Microcoleus sp. POL10_C6 TaxID=2818852 RepID=UPI002FD4FC35
MAAFKNAPQFPEAELEIGGGVRLGCCLTIAITPNPHIQLNITQHKPIAFNSTSRSHFCFHFKQIPQGALDVRKQVESRGDIIPRPSQLDLGVR